jgi:hypothetical protein
MIRINPGLIRREKEMIPINPNLIRGGKKDDPDQSKDDPDQTRDDRNRPFRDAEGQAFAFLLLVTPW